MKTTEKIKEQTKELEKEISKMINKFIEENGICDIRIDTNMRFLETQSRGIVYTGNDISIKINI